MPKHSQKYLDRVRLDASLRKGNFLPSPPVPKPATKMSKKAVKADEPKT